MTVQRIHLVVLGEDLAGTFPVEVGPGGGQTYVSIGRAPNAHLRFDDPHLSSLAAVIACSGGVWKVTFLGQGGQLDGLPVLGEHALKQNAVLSFAPAPVRIRVAQLPGPRHGVVGTKPRALVRKLSVDAARCRVSLLVRGEPEFTVPLSEALALTFKEILKNARRDNGGLRAWDDVLLEELRIDKKNTLEARRKRLNTWWRTQVQPRSPLLRARTTQAPFAGERGGEGATFLALPIGEVYLSDGSSEQKRHVLA